jgi:HD-GYP domain-containing protein (c-di-GMP phosphodiesterase class II)
VLEHHERIDGKGYPKGIKGDEISIQAKIIAIADTYDAMISDRSYRKALSESYAVSEMIRGAGTQFDAELTKLFVEKVLGKKWEITE